MTARVLIVDDIPINIKLLETRLMAEYFTVLSANSGPEALEICATQEVDIILLDVMMPEMDGFEVCRRLKSDPHTHHIPVVMVTALDQPSDRVAGLEAGADEFLSKPIDSVQLMARVKSLVRLKTLTDELRSRAATGQQIAVEDSIQVMESIGVEGSEALIIDMDSYNANHMRNILLPFQKVDILADPSQAVLQIAEKNYELIILNMDLVGHDPLRICSQIRTLEQGRHVPIILVAEESNKDQVVRGLELGVNDFIMRPVEQHELIARVKTQIRRFRYAAELRDSVSSTMQLAIVDDLTGLYNRRYFDRHLELMLSKAQTQGRKMAVMMLDIDHFKAVNDTYGHEAGDKILQEFSLRIQNNIRGVDLPCRYGGEEFVVLMPDTSPSDAANIAERVRRAVESNGFDAGTGSAIAITVSAGVALNVSGTDEPAKLLKRADVALYQAKHNGRNRVVFDAA
jgi:two-component system cell cycle response regulator